MNEERKVLLTFYSDGSIWTERGMTTGQVRQIGQRIMAAADQVPIPSINGNHQNVEQEIKQAD